MQSDVGISGDYDVVLVVVLIVALVMVVFVLVGDGDVGVSGGTDRSVTSTVMMWCKWG